MSWESLTVTEALEWARRRLVFAESVVDTHPGLSPDGVESWRQWRSVVEALERLERLGE